MMTNYKGHVDLPLDDMSPILSTVDQAAVLQGHREKFESQILRLSDPIARFLGFAQMEVVAGVLELEHIVLSELISDAPRTHQAVAPTLKRYLAGAKSIGDTTLTLIQARRECASLRTAHQHGFPS